MKKTVPNQPRGAAGFTLIELIIVIAILGVLAMIAIPSYSAYTDQAKQARDEQTASIALNAMAMYCAQNHIINATTAIDTSDEWKAVLNTAGLWKTSEQGLESDYYGSITLSGPVDGVCTVILDGATDYEITK